jgi:hypothetical protein
VTSATDTHGADAVRQRIVVVSTILFRFSVALQALGVGLQRLGLGGEWEDESPVFGLLMFDWGWSQAVAQRIDDVGAWLYFICGTALVILPVCGTLLRMMFGRRQPLLQRWLWQAPLCLIVASWQAIQIVVAWYRGGYFMSEWTLASESCRLALPVALLVLTPGPWSTDNSTQRLKAGMWLLRAAACLTFLAHGLKSYALSPVFVDYLISAGAGIGWQMSQSLAEALLRIIGVLDITAATLIIAVRWRAVAFYMATWALIGALARMVQSGWEAHFEVLVRAGNYCVPLIIGLIWHLSRTLHSVPAGQEDLIDE